MLSVLRQNSSYDESELVAQAGANQLASDIEAWERQKSGVARYLKRDLLTEQVISRITSDVKESSETTLSKLSISLVYLVILTSAVLWLAGYVWGFEGPTVGDSTGAVQWILAQLLDALSVFGWSVELTGNKYVLTLIASTIVALLSETSISREVRRKTKEFVEIIEQTRRVVRNARQIFVGSGQIRFSYGNLGVWVRGGNLDLYIRWGAIAEGILFKKEKDDWRLADSPADASHFFIFLKPRSDSDEEYSAEFLVVPKRFFNKPIDASSWEEFVSDFHS